MNVDLKNDKRKLRLLERETPAEQEAFKLLTERRLLVKKQKIFRQKSGRTFFVDLWLPHYALAIEIDGGIHLTTVDRDAVRDMDIMTNNIIALLRFTNNDVLFRKSYFLGCIHQMLVTRINYLNTFQDGRRMLTKADRHLENLSEQYKKYYSFANLPILYNSHNLLDWWEDNLDGFDMNDSGTLPTDDRKSVNSPSKSSNHARDFITRFGGYAPYAERGVFLGKPKIPNSVIRRAKWNIRPPSIDRHPKPPR